MPGKSANPIAAAVYGGLLAVVIACVMSYGGLWLRVANMTAPGAPAEHGVAALMRAGLNLYAMQHVTLAGSGTLTSEFSGSQAVADVIKLPLTLWAVIPAFALFIGGYAAGSRRRGTSVLGITIPATFAGVVYALVLAACTYAVSGKLHPSAFPAISGWEFNPHDILVRPGMASTLWSAGLFGVVFAFLGGMLASRGDRGRLSSGPWWICGKSIILTALVIQLVLAAAIGVMLSRTSEDKLPTPLRWQIFSMSPTATAIGYSMMHGATLSGAITAPGQSENETPAGYVNIYTGTKLTGFPKQPKPISPTVLSIVKIIGALAAFAAGGLAVRWGSRDGSVLTALRITILLAAYAYALSFISGFGWRGQEGAYEFSLQVGVGLGLPALWAIVAAFFCSLLGAYLTSAWYIGRRGGFPSSL